MNAKQRDELLKTLKDRFETHMHRHTGLVWSKIHLKLEVDAGKIRSLYEMEKTGGEPDVVKHDKKTGEYVFYDCSAESPNGRRSVCYDREGLESRKEHRPGNNAIDLAAAMGIEILTEEQYRELQGLGVFDAKTSSWIKTPAGIRTLGGALFADYRYGHVFVYHNGAQSNTVRHEICAMRILLNWHEICASHDWESFSVILAWSGPWRARSGSTLLIRISRGLNTSRS